MSESYYDWNPALEKSNDKVYFKWDQNAGPLMDVQGKKVHAGRPKIVRRVRVGDTLVYEMALKDFEEMWWAIKRPAKRRKS